MSTTDSGERYRISIEVTGTRAVRVSVKKLDGDKYVYLDHPWGQNVLMAIRTGRKVVNLLAQGISDTDDVMKIVNERRRSRRRGMKKPPTGKGLFSEDSDSAKSRRH
jgi:hypothetical protein